MSAVASVFDRLTLALADVLSDVTPEFGPAALHTKTNGHKKIVIAPGDESLSFGKISATEMLSGGTAQRLATLDELFRVYVSAFDPCCPADSKIQHIATDALWKVVYAALFSTYRAFLPVGCKWVYGSVISPFGAALMMTCTVRDFISGDFEVEAFDAAPKGPRITEKLTAPSGEE